MAKKDFEPNELFWTARTALSLSRAAVADIANTQSVLASCQHEPLTENYVGRIEQGRIGGGMCPERLTALCAVLHVADPGKIGLVAERRLPTRYGPAGRRKTQRPFPARDHNTQLEAPQPLLRIMPQPSRRVGFPGRGTMAGVVSPAQSVVSASAPIAEWVDRMRHGVAEAARCADAHFVNVVRMQLETAKSLDGSYGAAAALSTAKGVIDVVEAITPEVPEDVRSDVLVLGTEAAEFIGWLFRDLADPVQAGFWYDRAMEYAQMSGELSMQGFVLLRKSQMAYEARSAERVHLLARAAIEGPWQLPARFHAEALLQVARGALMVGLSVNLEDVVERARDAAAGEDLTLREASCWIEARQPERAAQIYEDGLAVDGLSLRDAGYFRARQATALAQAHSPNLAAEKAFEALSTSVVTGSQRTYHAVVATRTVLTRWQSHDAVVALQDALMDYESSTRQQLQSPAPAMSDSAG